MKSSQYHKRQKKHTNLYFLEKASSKIKKKKGEKKITVIIMGQIIIQNKTVI